jgi:hypothetical protein
VIASLLLCGLVGTHAPEVVVIASGGREARLPVLADAGGAPIISAPLLLTALNGSVRVNNGWADVVVSRQPFRFLVGAPLYIFSNQLQPLAAPASLRRDTLYLPFQFVAEVLPYYLSERYRYDGHGRLEVPARQQRRSVFEQPTPAACPTVCVRATALPSIPGTAASTRVILASFSLAACERKT